MADEAQRAQTFCVELAAEMRAAVDQMTALDAASFEAHLGSLDREFGQFHRKVEACRRYLELYRVAKVEQFSFGEAFHRWNPSSDGVVLGFEGEGKLPLSADARQMLVCLDLIALNARVDSPGDFEIRVHAASDPPNLFVRLSGGQGPDTAMSFGHGLDVTWDALGARWAAATRGGLLHHAAGDEVVLDLRGDGTFGEGIAEFGPAEEALRRAERAMMPWRGAIGNTQTGYAEPGEVAGLYASHLRRAAEQLSEAGAIIGGGKPH